MPLDETTAMVVSARSRPAIGRSLWRQLTRRYPGCTTAAAIVHLDALLAVTPELDEAWSKVRVLLDEKSSLLTRVRRDVSYKAMIDFWLLLHVPLSFMLLAALFAHIVSVFFLW